MLPNRIAVYLTGLAGLATALAGPVANLDTSSSITLSVGGLMIASTVIKFLEGWQRYEERTDLEAIVADQVGTQDVPASGQ